MNVFCSRILSLLLPWTCIVSFSACSHEFEIALLIFVDLHMCDCGDMEQVNGSLLPAAVIAVYCTYLCYSALSSEPRGYECNGLHNHVNAVSKGTLVLGMLTTLLSVVYSAVRAGSSTSFYSPPTSPREGITCLKCLLC